MSFAWGRVFFVYGPHENSARLATAVITSLIKGQPVKTTHGQQIRDFSHVMDIAGGFAALLDSIVTGAVNLGSGRPTAVRELIQILAELLGRPELVEYGALPLAADEPPLLVADIRRLRKEAGFTPKFELTEGLLATVDTFKSRADVKIS
jgi:nucleoside-diphosphate-sugar epimerase